MTDLAYPRMSALGPGHLAARAVLSNRFSGPLMALARITQPMVVLGQPAQRGTHQTVVLQAAGRQARQGPLRQRHRVGQPVVGCRLRPKRPGNAPQARATASAAARASAALRPVWPAPCRADPPSSRRRSGCTKPRSSRRRSRPCGSHRGCEHAPRRPARYRTAPSAHQCPGAACCSGGRFARPPPTPAPS